MSRIEQISIELSGVATALAAAHTEHCEYVVGVSVSVVTLMTTMHEVALDGGAEAKMHRAFANGHRQGAKHCQTLARLYEKRAALLEEIAALSEGA